MRCDGRYLSLCPYSEWLQWEERGEAVPVHGLAWPRGTRAPYSVLSLLETSESLQSSRCRAHGGALQVGNKTTLQKSAKTWNWFLRSLFAAMTLKIHRTKHGTFMFISFFTSSSFYKFTSTVSNLSSYMLRCYQHHNTKRTCVTAISKPEHLLLHTDTQKHTDLSSYATPQGLNSFLWLLHLKQITFTFTPSSLSPAR